MGTLPNDVADFAALAAERKPIGGGDNGGRHVMALEGDELTGRIVSSETVDGKYGEFTVIKVDPVKAISEGVDTTALGEVELRCTGHSLEGWYEREQPQPGDLVSIQLTELKDTGKDSPLKVYAIALRRDPGPEDRPPHTDADVPPLDDDDLPF